MSKQQEYLTAIANAIRTKENSTAAIPAKEFAQRILDLQASGGSDTPPANMYEIKVLINDLNGGNVSDGGMISESLAKSAVVTISASKNSGYKFNGWFMVQDNGEEILVTNALQYSFTPTGSVTFIANYSIQANIAGISWKYIDNFMGIVDSGSYNVQHFENIEIINGFFIAKGSNCLYYSEDGLSWKTTGNCITPASGYTASNVTNVVYWKGYWYALTSRYNSTSINYYFSIGRASSLSGRWTTVYNISARVLGTESSSTLICTDTRLVCIIKPYTSSATYYYSTTGSSWSTATFPEKISAYDLFGFMFNGRCYVKVVSDLYESTDGYTWTKITPVISFTWYDGNIKTLGWNYAIYLGIINGKVWFASQSGGSNVTGVLICTSDMNEFEVHLIPVYQNSNSTLIYNSEDDTYFYFNSYQIFVEDGDLPVNKNNPLVYAGAVFSQDLDHWEAVEWPEDMADNLRKTAASGSITYRAADVYGIGFINGKMYCYATGHYGSDIYDTFQYKLLECSAE